MRHEYFRSIGVWKMFFVKENDTLKFVVKNMVTQYTRDDFKDGYQAYNFMLAAHLSYFIDEREYFYSFHMN